MFAFVFSAANLAYFWNTKIFNSHRGAEMFSAETPGISICKWIGKTLIVFWAILCWFLAQRTENSPKGKKKKKRGINNKYCFTAVYKCTITSVFIDFQFMPLQYGIFNSNSWRNCDSISLRCEDPDSQNY